MDVSTLLDLVYESKKDQISSNFELKDDLWGNVREQLRQAKWEYENEFMDWDIDYNQLNTFEVEYTARFEDYVIEGVIEGKKEDMEYF